MIAADTKLEARGISVSLARRRILHRFDFDVGPGEMIAIIGANGAGKSTLLRSLAGLLKCDEGRVLLNGRPIESYAPRERARHIAYLPQDRIVHWSLDVAHVVGLGRLPYRTFAASPSDADRRAVEAAMQRVDVAQFSERPIATLSGGERARVLLARALAQGAQFLIADEPTAGLDPAHTLAMFAEFVRLVREGYTIIAALHDLSLAARFATRIVLIREGVCFANGPPAQVLSSDNINAAFHVDAAMGEIGGIPVVVPRLQ